MEAKRAEQRSKATEVLDSWKSFLDESTLVGWVKAGLCVATSYAVLKYISTVIYRRYKKYAPGPLDIPFIGHVTTFTDGFLLHQCGYYGAITYTNMLGKHCVIVNDSQTAKRLILNKKEFVNRETYQNGDKDENNRVMSIFYSGMHNPSFLDSNNDIWKKRRQYAMVALIRFCDSKFMSQTIYDIMNNVVFKQLNKICDENVNIWYPNEICYFLSFNTVYHANFGRSLTMDDARFIEMKKMITDQSDVLKELMVPSVFDSMYDVYEILYPALMKKFKNAMQKSEEIYLNLLNERREHFKQNPSIIEQIKNNNFEKYHLCYIDYLVYLLDYNDKNEKTYLNEIRAINDLALLFFAGTDTTANTIQYGVLLLAKSPKIQELLYECLRKISNDGDSDINIGGMLQLSDLLNCVHFRAFIYEVLRISSAVPMGLPHRSTKDVTIKMDKNGKSKEYFIPNNCVINANIEYIHMNDNSDVNNKENWKNKEYGLSMDQLCLENWFVKNNDNDEPKFVLNESFIGFGHGSRDCVGQQLAIKELHLVFAYFILNYQFKPEKKDNFDFKIPRKFGITAGIESNAGVQISKRFDK